MSLPQPTSTDAPLHVYRTGPARVVGWGMVAAALVLSALTVRDLLTGREHTLIPPLALIVGVAAAGWVLFLRPRAALFEDRVELTNLVTDTVVPFAVVEEVTHQWALELHDKEGHRHSAWAVPVRREMTRRRTVDDFAETTRRRGSAGMTAQGAADEVLRQISRWKLAGGESPAASPTEPQVRTTVAWPAVAVLGVAVVLAVAAILS